MHIIGGHTFAWFSINTSINSFNCNHLPGKHIELLNCILYG